MSAMTTPAIPVVVWHQCKRIAPLGLIILLHIGFFYVLQSGLLHQVKQALPKEVFATFITPEPVKAPPAPPAPPAPAPPRKTVPVVERQVSKAPTPVIDKTPAPAAITTPVAATTEPVATPVPSAPPAPPAPAAPAPPKTISSGVEYIQAPQPEYPSASRRMNEEGKTILRVLINERGQAERIEVQKSSGSPRLDTAARQAVQRAVFKPYIEDGKALAVYAIVPINFQLD